MRLESAGRVGSRSYVARADLEEMAVVGVSDAAESLCLGHIYSMALDERFDAGLVWLQSYCTAVQVCRYHVGSLRVCCLKTSTGTDFRSGSGCYRSVAADGTGRGLKCIYTRSVLLIVAVSGELLFKALRTGCPAG